MANTIEQKNDPNDIKPANVYKNFFDAFDDGKSAQLYSIQLEYNKLSKQQQLKLKSYKFSNTGNSLLISSILSGNINLSTWLLSIGCNPTLRDKIRASALGWAIYNNQEVITSILLSHQSVIKEYKISSNYTNKKYQNIYGQTIMHSCIQSNNKNILSLVLSFGIFDFLLDVKDNNGKLPEDLTNDNNIKNIITTHRQKLKKQLNDGSDCLVCYDKERKFAFLPCGHRCVCKDCAQQIQNMSKKCPVCRADVLSINQIYV